MNMTVQKESLVDLSLIHFPFVWLTRFTVLGLNFSTHLGKRDGGRGAPAPAVLAFCSLSTSSRLHCHAVGSVTMAEAAILDTHTPH